MGPGLPRCSGQSWDIGKVGAKGQSGRDDKISARRDPPVKQCTKGWSRRVRSLEEKEREARAKKVSRSGRPRKAQGKILSLGEPPLLPIKQGSLSLALQRGAANKNVPWLSMNDRVRRNLEEAGAYGPKQANQMLKCGKLKGKEVALYADEIRGCMTKDIEMEIAKEAGEEAGEDVDLFGEMSERKSLWSLTATEDPTVGEKEQGDLIERGKALLQRRSSALEAPRIQDHLGVAWTDG